MNIAFIPLRGGSKSIPLKNIKLFCGEPLVYWSINALIHSKSIDKIVIATDHSEIRSYCKTIESTKIEIFNRSSENAQDHSSTESVILEYLIDNPLNINDYFMLVQATSPFLTSKEIDSAFDYIKNSSFSSILSCVRLKRFLWNEEGMALNYDYLNRPRRQDFKGELMENGAFYISKVGDILKTKNRISGKIGLFEMPEYSAIEIDEEIDWVIAEELFNKYLKVDLFKTSKIKMFITDVDGVLTDAGMYYSESGDETKKFNTHDGMAFQLLREAGIKTAIITSENTKIVERRAKKLRVDHLYQGIDKMSAALEICKKEGISMNDVAYIGDDINCLELLSNVGLCACPANATKKIKAIKGIKILNTKGGEGVVRELVEIILGT